MTDFGVPSLLDLLTDDERDRLAAAARRRTYRDGQEILAGGQEPNGISIVIEGAVTISRMRGDGETALATEARAGQNFFDIVAINHSSPKHRATAVGDTVVDHVPRARFLQLLAEEPGLARALYHVTASRLVVAIDMWDDARLLSAHPRIAKMLLRMLAGAPQPDRLECRQEDLGHLVGVSAVTIAQGLRRLADEGLIQTGYGEIRIPDPSALQAWVDRETGS